MKSSMDISSHAFGITTYINVTSLREQVPNIRGLYIHNKHGLMLPFSQLIKFFIGKVTHVFNEVMNPQLHPPPRTCQEVPVELAFTG